ncbi:MAG: hypothetical protein KH452_10090 [Clostridiales bacterium]|nr:hypothetical protein [Clostridiales bacterium]
MKDRKAVDEVTKQRNKSGIKKYMVIFMVEAMILISPIIIYGILITDTEKGVLIDSIEGYPQGAELYIKTSKGTYEIKYNLEELNEIYHENFKIGDKVLVIHNVSKIPAIAIYPPRMQLIYMKRL